MPLTTVARGSTCLREPHFPAFDPTGPVAETEGKGCFSRHRRRESRSKRSEGEFPMQQESIPTSLRPQAEAAVS